MGETVHLNITDFNLHLTLNCIESQTKQNKIRMLALGIALETSCSSPCFSDEKCKARGEKNCSIIQVRLYNVLDIINIYTISHR